MSVQVTAKKKISAKKLHESRTLLRKTLQGYRNRIDEFASVQEPTRKGYGNTSRDIEISAQNLLTQSLVLALKLNQWCCEIVETLQPSFEQSQQMSGPA